MFKRIRAAWTEAAPPPGRDMKHGSVASVFKVDGKHRPEADAGLCDAAEVPAAVVGRCGSAGVVVDAACDSDWDCTGGISVGSEYRVWNHPGCDGRDWHCLSQPQLLSWLISKGIREMLRAVRWSGAGGDAGDPVAPAYSRAFTGLVAIGQSSTCGIGNSALWAANCRPQKRLGDSA